jgi:hypothetical protein
MTSNAIENAQAPKRNVVTNFVLSTIEKYPLTCGLVAAAVVAPFGLYGSSFAGVFAGSGIGFKLDRSNVGIPGMIFGGALSLSISVLTSLTLVPPEHTAAKWKSEVRQSIHDQVGNGQGLVKFLQAKNFCTWAEPRLFTWKRDCQDVSLQITERATQRFPGNIVEAEVSENGLPTRTIYLVPNNGSVAHYTEAALSAPAPGKN